MSADHSTAATARSTHYLERFSARKEAIRAAANRMAEERDDWIDRNRYFHDQDYSYLRFLIPEGMRVLDLGCGTGQLLSALKPAYGVGIDISEKMIEVAKAKYPDCTFYVGDIEDVNDLRAIEGPFDVIVMSDTLGYLNDCENTLNSLHALCTPETRIVVSYYSHIWEPILNLGVTLGQRMPTNYLNWLSMDDISHLLSLADFEVVKKEWRQLVPKKIFGVGTLINRYVATLPIIRKLSLRHYLVARPYEVTAEQFKTPSTSVVIPCRNEEGNIEPAVKRLPHFCDDMEIIFVEGHSQDGTWEEIQRVKGAYPNLNIVTLQQPGKGKGDAVRTAFDAASKDILMILDADLTVPPEDLPKFYKAIASGKGEYINGTRLIYPMENEAMRLLNYWANHTFAHIFSYLLNQRFSDTLCGTKVLSRQAYAEIKKNRHYFGDFDPFGDFDLIFGASKLNLKMVEVPIRYDARSYGSTQISRFSHGWLLLRMVVFAYRKLKAI